MPEYTFHKDCELLNEDVTLKVVYQHTPYLPATLTDPGDAEEIEIQTITRLTGGDVTGYINCKDNDLWSEIEVDCWEHLTDLKMAGESNEN